jgi:rfaE bifunctional protein kinase chain/domain
MTLELPEFRGLSVAVAGDVICDRYLYCEPKSLSREAPVMVLRHLEDRVRAGGAGNVARNLTALGAATTLFGVVGRDVAGREARLELEHDLVGVEGLASVAGWTTPLKTRVVAAEARRNMQQVLRIDTEAPAPADAAARHDVLARLRASLSSVDAMVISDYSYGFVDRELGRLAREFALGGHVVVIDPRESLAGFEGLTALTPNVTELAHFAGVAPESLTKTTDLEAAALSVLERCRARWMLVTRGNNGMALFGEGVPRGGWAVEASGTGNVTDVTGAGDTAAAVFALALARGVDAPNAMLCANAASGVVVMESGASVCTTRALREALAGAPLLTPLAGSARP